jgi:ATP-dependent helicase/nuclease subunit A
VVTISPNPRLSDQDARDSIGTMLDRNLLVEASAGSGKTHSLTQRMVAGIASGHYLVDHMAAVTFTRKAAAELRGRFRLALEERLTREADEQARARLAAALANVERFFAGTIHSFCARLLHERPVEAGLAPGFTELDDVSDAELRERHWREYLGLLRSGAVPRDVADAWTELQQAGIRPADLDSAFRILCTFEEIHFPPGDGQPPDVRAGWAAFDQFWTKLEALLPASISEDATCEVQVKARECRWRRRLARRDTTADLAHMLNLWDGGLKITQKNWH